MGKIGTMGKMRLKTAETTKTVETTEITEKKLIPEFRCRLFRLFRPYCP